MLKTDVIIKCAFIEMHLKSQKHLITNLFTHSSTMFKNRPKCLVLPNNVKKWLDGVISKDFALIRKLHLQFLPSLKLIFPFLIDFLQGFQHRCLELIIESPLSKFVNE